MAAPQSSSALKDDLHRNYHYLLSLSTSELFDAYIISGHFFCRNARSIHSMCVGNIITANNSDRLSNKIGSDGVDGNDHD